MVIIDLVLYYELLLYVEIQDYIDLNTSIVGTYSPLTVKYLWHCELQDLYYFA